MDDGDMTTTKPVENCFGNLDRELRKCGSKGFNKAYNLIIKTSKDLILPNSFDWRTKANRNQALELNFLDSEIY